MKIDDLQLRFDHGLWLGAIPSCYGLLELLLTGSEDGPDERQLEAFQRFSSDLDNNIKKLSKQLSWSFLYRPIRIAINAENKVGVQFQNRFTGNQRQLVLESALGKDLKVVPGAAAVTHEGKVIYNLLTPHMQQFMGRCIGAIKKTGIKAQGTGQFSILLVDKQVELPLEPFYTSNSRSVS